MQSHRDRRRRTPLSATAADWDTAEEGWISILGQGSGFHDCPLCRELASQSEAVEAFVGVRRESLPLLVRTGWLDELVELVGRNATVRVMGRDMEAQPVEVISMEIFLARLGYE